jgi:alkylation response protein AidB-like acyl-CoA dehydrogenase
VTSSSSEECLALRDSARALIGERAPVETLRRLRDENDARGYDQGLWLAMVGLGWSGILVPQEHGGAGLGFLELGVVLEECGRHLVPSPLMSTALLAAAALNGPGDERRARFLRSIAAGEAIFSLAHEERAHHRELPVETKVTRSADGFRLFGQKSFVLDGHVADHFVVSARPSEAGDDDGAVTLLLVDAQSPGVKVTRTQMVDSHNAALVRFDDVMVEADDVLAEGRRAADILHRVLDAGAVGAAAQMLGGAEEAFARTVAYLKERRQFGVPIGSFQALQHRAAQVFCELELSKSVLLDALAALDEDRADASLAVSAAKAQLCETSRLVTNEAIQMHGGIGMTDEHEIGFFLKRARVLAQTFGDHAFHADRFATLSGY